MQDRNEFQSLVKQKGSDTKEHTDFTYAKYNVRQNLSMVIEIRKWLPVGRGLLINRKGTQETF